MARTAAATAARTAAMLAICSCHAQPTGTVTPLGALRSVAVRVLAAPGTAADAIPLQVDPRPVEDRRSRLVTVAAQVTFAEVGITSDSGAGCPVLSPGATASFDDRPAASLQRGGPQAQGLVKTTSYVCGPVGLVSPPLMPPLGRPLVIALRDDSGTFRVEIDGLFSAGQAALVGPDDGRIVFGSTVRIALPAGSSARARSATLWQRRADGWGGFPMPAMTAAPDGLAVLLTRAPAPELLEPGPHLLEAAVDGLAAGVLGCPAGWTCAATPLDRLGPFDLAIAE
jgi:hypothetical protein